MGKHSGEDLPIPVKKAEKIVTYVRAGKRIKDEDEKVMTAIRTYMILRDTAEHNIKGFEKDRTLPDGRPNPTAIKGIEIETNKIKGYTEQIDTLLYKDQRLPLEKINRVRRRPSSSA